MPALAFCLGYAGVALSITMLGPMVPVIQATYKVSLAYNGFLTFAQGVGCLVAAIIGIVIADKYNKRTVMVIAYVLYNAMLYLSALLPPYWMLAVLFFLLGTGARLFDALVNANMSELDAEKKGFFMNLLHGAFGFGALFGPVIASKMLEEYDLGSSLLAIAVICSALFTACILMGKNGKESPLPTNPVSNNELRSSLVVLLKNRMMWILGLCSMLYVGFAIAIATWIPSYMMEIGASNFFAAAVVSFLWVGIIAGRFTYSVLSLRFSMKKLIFISNLIGGITIVCATVVNTVGFFVIGYLVAGFFSGAVVPLSVAITSKEFPSASGRVSSIIVFFVAIGSMLIPAMIGIIAEKVSFYNAVFILNLCPLLIAALSSLLVRDLKQKLA